MKIDDSFSASGELRSPLVGPTKQIHVADPAQESREETPASDSASLSALSVELSQALENEPPETVARIQRLQEAVANGTYSVSSAEVASRIVSAALAEGAE